MSSEWKKLLVEIARKECPAVQEQALGDLTRRRVCLVRYVANEEPQKEYGKIRTKCFTSGHTMSVTR